MTGAIELTGEALAAIVAAAIGGWVALIVGGLKLWGEFTRVRSALGQPNGDGSLVDMAQQLLRGQTGQDSRLASLERGQIDQARQLDVVDTRLEHVDTRLEVVDTRLDDVDERLAS